jgi:cell division protease FtsH
MQNPNLHAAAGGNGSPPAAGPPGPPARRAGSQPGGAAGGGDTRTGRPPGVSRRRVALLALLGLVLLSINYFIVSSATQPQERVRVPYSPVFLHQAGAGNVREVTSTGTAVQGTFKQPVRYPNRSGGTRSTEFSTEIPAFANTNALARLLQSNGVVVNAEPLETGAPLWQTLVFGFGPTVLLVALLVWWFRRSAAGGGVLGSFTRSSARRYDAASAEKVTFADVAGIDEAKDELAEVVDFLRSPERYGALGGRIPRGVLLSGPPGTGKTLLARAVAGEAAVPFFSMSASEFVEMIVGVGASRARDLFAQAKKAAPAIVFIDELDAIGRSRAAGAGFGGNDEREQTLNQILTEMDGFHSSTGVIVIGATNRPEVLDPALLRPGRFDRRIAVQPPDRRGRELILRVHTRDMPLAADVDPRQLASTTPGMVGADLANLANEAALLAARRRHAQVTMADFTDSLERIVLGAERKIVLSEADRERTAYHEGGHALVGMLNPHADPVRKVSIIPRGSALGVTFASPEADRFSYEEPHLRARLQVALGGRAAEQLVFGEVSTGAEADIRQLTEVARAMVSRWGMSRRLGPVALVTDDDQAPLRSTVDGPSDETRRVIDSEVHRLVEEALEEATALLRDHRHQLDALAHALIERETLDEVEAYAAAHIEGSSNGSIGAASGGAGG